MAIVENPQNPCLTCGACCAYYRATFYWRESDADTPGGVPTEMTVDITQFLCAMRGTHLKNPRCVALEGIIGESVYCSIYERRPTVCREFPPSYENGPSNPRCDKARIAHGLPPINCQSFKAPG